MKLVLELPELSDEAVVAIHDFLLDAVTRFENRHFAQLHRYYHDFDEQRHRDRTDPIPPSDTDVPF